MDHQDVRSWLARYFAAWISNEPTDVAALFADDALYQVGPFAEPWLGRDEIVRQWTSGSADLRHHAYEVLGVNGDRAIAHWNVVVGIPTTGPREYDGILLLAFDGDGRCVEHKEWFVTPDL